MSEEINKELKRIAKTTGRRTAKIKVEKFYTKTLYYLDGLAVLAVCGGELWPYY